MTNKSKSVKPPCPAVGKIARGSLHCNTNVLAPALRVTSKVVSLLGAIVTALFGVYGQPVGVALNTTPSGVCPVPTACTRAECVAPKLPADELSATAEAATESPVVAAKPFWNAGSVSNGM